MGTPWGLSLEQRFLMKVAKGDGCWHWLGAKDKLGYGKVFIEKRADGRNVVRGAHRVSWEIHRGPIPAGLVIDHLCRNPNCVNPAHLDLVTSFENADRGIPGAQSRKRFCIHGHERTEANTRISKAGNKVCRPCDAERQRRRRGAVVHSAQD